MSKQAKPPPSSTRRDQQVNLPTSETPRDVSWDYEHVQVDGLQTEEDKTRPLLDVRTSLVAAQALRQTRQHHLNNLFPIFTSPGLKPKPKPKPKAKSKPNVHDAINAVPEPEVLPAKETAMEQDPLPPHRLRLLGTCRLTLGPITIDQVNLWECRWENPQAVLPARPLPHAQAKGRPQVQVQAKGSVASPMLSQPQPRPRPQIPFRPAPTPASSSSSTPVKAMTPAGPSRSNSGTPGIQQPSGSTPRPAGPLPISRELVGLVNLAAETHPWLRTLIHSAAVHTATLPDLKKLGGVVEILNNGFELPHDIQAAQKAAENVLAYVRGGAKKRVPLVPASGTGGDVKDKLVGKVVTPAVKTSGPVQATMPTWTPTPVPISAPVLRPPVIPTPLPAPMRVMIPTPATIMPPAAVSASAASRPSPVKTPAPASAATTKTTGSKIKVTPGGPSAPIPEYPLILVSFAENPSVKFVLPFPFSYTSFRPTVSPPSIAPALPLPPGYVRAKPARRGDMLFSTFLPSKGWGRWTPENEASSESARKRRRKDFSSHARLGLPKEDRDFSLGGCTIPPGAVEPVTIRFEDMGEYTWLALKAVEKETETCLEQRRRRLEQEKEKEVERAKKTAEKKNEAELVVPTVGTENGTDDSERKMEAEDEDEIVCQKPGTASVKKVAPAVEPEKTTTIVETAPADVPKPSEPSPKRPKRDSKKKRWSDGEEDIVPTSINARTAKAATNHVEPEDEAVVVGDDPSKTFKARVFNQLLKRVTMRRYLKLRLPEPLPDDLVKASTHMSDPVIKNLTVGKAGQGHSIVVAPVESKKRPRTLLTKRNSVAPSAKRIRSTATTTTPDLAAHDHDQLTPSHIPPPSPSDLNDPEPVTQAVAPTETT